MDQQLTPKIDVLDSTLIVTMTVGQLRELIRDEVQAARTSQNQGDRLLDVKETAKMVSMSEDWLYRNAKKLPFTRKLGPKVLRFSYLGIIKWLPTRQLTKN